MSVFQYSIGCAHLTTSVAYLQALYMVDNDLQGCQYNLQLFNLMKPVEEHNNGDNSVNSLNLFSDLFTDCSWSLLHSHITWECCCKCSNLWKSEIHKIHAIWNTWKSEMDEIWNTQNLNVNSEIHGNLKDTKDEIHENLKYKSEIHFPFRFCIFRFSCVSDFVHFRFPAWNSFQISVHEIYFRFPQGEGRKNFLARNLKNFLPPKGR